MGIKNLNKLVKRLPMKDAKADYLIIDGYNVVITLIQSILGMTRENVVGSDIIEIFKYLVNSISGRIQSLIENTVKRYSCETVMFVIDGVTQKPLQMDSGEFFDIKQSEHEKRQAQLTRQKERVVNSIIETTTEDNHEKELERRFFELGDNYHYLIFPIIDKICHMNASKGDSFQLIESVYEADYTIANLANSLGNSVIMSLDTDFYVMCCEDPTIYILNFKEQQHIYCPRVIWNDIFDKCGLEFNLGLVYRLAPLFGNDYTASGSDKQAILSAEDEDSLQIVFLRDVDYGNTRKKKIRVFKDCIRYTSEVITLEALDVAVQEFSKINPKYETFNDKYCKSVYAYENMAQYFEFEDYVPRDNGLEIIRKLFPKPLQFETNEYADLL